MAQLVMDSFFKDDPFFDQARLLWPPQRTSCSRLREDFMRRRAQLVEGLCSDLQDGLLSELREGLQTDLFKTIDRLHSSASRSRFESPSAEQRNLPLTVNTQGFSPEDVTVTLSGKKLEVMAAKRAEVSQSAATSSSTSSSSSSASQSQKQGFIQRVTLPEHVDMAAITCSMGEDGLLHIEAPENQQETSEEQIVPIRFRTSLDVLISKTSTADSSSEKSTNN
ncbi:heat shock protein beta-9 [Denticeps clupeoides]|uniref:heat shock protein beta-9 n=1 Tax=Denticeps clupeoides TaxID=299321 RepID=UPI0010A39334|nr:heat shock protein 30-like [Denticeps clupeoides]